MPNIKEIKGTTINYQEFDRRLQVETALLEDWFVNRVFAERGLSIGSEIEFFILDAKYDPVPDSLHLIELVAQDYLVCEVGAAQLEINLDPLDFSADCLSKMHECLLKRWKTICDVAKKNNYQVAMIGTLPTASKEHSRRSFLTNKARYHLLDSCSEEHRNGQPIILEIEGTESLIFHPESCAMNGLVSAFQSHIQIGLSQSVRYYNAAQLVAAPMLALSCNSPFIFGKQLWSETRVAIFDQVMAMPTFDRVTGFHCCTFGINYLKESFFELFDQNLQLYPRLIPEVATELPPEVMFHVRRQNGVVYRWNRPVIDFNELNQPHLRIEHRGPSTGPTVVDMIANAAFFYGILNYYALQTTPMEHLLPFQMARKNFFNAARNGLDAKFQWVLGQEITACKLIKTLIPLARKGLEIFNIDIADTKYYLDIIERRIALKTNGSDWQRRFIDKYGPDFHNMMAVYLENQYQELPVSEWKI